MIFTDVYHFRTHNYPHLQFYVCDNQSKERFNLIHLAPHYQLYVAECKYLMTFTFVVSFVTLSIFSRASDRDQYI